MYLGTGVRNGSRKMRYMLKRTMLVIMRRLMFLKLFR